MQELRKGKKMAKKDVMKINVPVSACKGTFDKNENDAYIVIVNGVEYLFEDYAEKFLGGRIELSSVEEE